MGKSKKNAQNWGFDTLALRAGHNPKDAFGSPNVPLHQTLAYCFESPEQAARIFAGEEEGFVYSRINNPTVDSFEKRMAALEGGEAALATSSGMSAIFLAVVHLAQKGDNFVSSSHLYGGTFNLFNVRMARFGIGARFIKDGRHSPTEARSRALFGIELNDPNRPECWEKLIDEKTKLIFIETPANPVLNVSDIGMLSGLAKKHGIPLIVDATLATPALQKTLALGADIVIHSASKFICGNGTSLGGVIVGKKKLIDEMRQGIYRDSGPALAPFNAWLYLLGLETLGLRMERHSKNALIAALLLQNHSRVKKVNYPFLPNGPDYAAAKKQMSGGGALLSFELAGGLKSGKKFIKSLKLVSHLANLGDSRTLAIHPASTTHAQVPKEEREKIGITDGLVRMSIGLENIEDILEDILQALEKV